MYKEIKRNLKESTNINKCVYVIEPSAGIYGPLSYIITDYNDYCYTVRGDFLLSFINYYNTSQKVKRILGKYRRLDSAPSNANEPCLVLDDSMGDSIYFGAEAEAKFQELQNSGKYKIEKYTPASGGFTNVRGFWD